MVSNLGAVPGALEAEGRGTGFGDYLTHFPWESNPPLHPWLLSPKPKNEGRIRSEGMSSLNGHVRAVGDIAAQTVGGFSWRMSPGYLPLASELPTGYKM